MERHHFAAQLQQLYHRSFGSDVRSLAEPATLRDTMPANDLVNLVLHSALIEERIVERIIEEWREVRESDPDAQLSAFFVDTGRITPWQMQHLGQGRYKGYFFEGYKLKDHLGGGGSTTVYLAEELSTRSEVAVKVCRTRYAADANYLAWFERQSAALQMDHPNLTKIYEVHSTRKQPYIIREAIAGRTLRELVHFAKVIPLEHIAMLLVEIASATAAVHSMGQVVCNLTPQDILLDHDGKIRVLVPGLSWCVLGRLLPELSSQEMPDYSRSPIGASNIEELQPTWRDDVLCMGYLLYFLLTTSSVPHADRSSVEYSIRKKRPETPDAFVELTAEALSIEPHASRPSADSIVAVLTKWLGGIDGT